MGQVRTSDGFAIGYTETGVGDATPIVFLHGVGSDKSVWLPQLEHFGADRRALAFDYPGYGDSDPAADETSRDDYAVAILSAMDVLDVERAHVCGLSLGGVVAIAMYAAEPNRCASLILADTFADHPEGQVIYDRAVLGSANMRVLAESRVDVLMAQPADAAIRAEVIETMARIDPAAYVIGAAAVWLANQRDRATAIREPTLVLCGTEDRVTPPALSHALARLIPGAQEALVEGAGHLANIERPQEFNTIVGAFIRGVDSRSS